MKNKKFYIFIIIFSLALLFYEGLIFNKEYYHIYPEGDFVANFSANLVNASYIKQGTIPFWNPLSFGGFSAIGTDHYETNPINPMLIFPYFFGLNSNTYFLLFFFILALISAFSYFRYGLNFGANISFIGSFIYTNVIYPPTNMNDGLIFACFPLALYLIHKYFKDNQFRMLFWLSILMAVIFLSSFCHRFLDMMFLVSVYYFILSVKYKKNLLRSFSSYCFFVFILIGLSAVTLFPQVFTASYEVRRNRPMIFEHGLSIWQLMQAAASFIFVHFIVPFKSVYIDFEDFSLKISRLLPVNSGNYLSILFVPAVIWLICRRKIHFSKAIKNTGKSYLSLYFLILFFILIIPTPYLTTRYHLHEQAYFALHYLQGYVSSVINLLLIIPILIFLKEVQENNKPHPVCYKATLYLFYFVIAMLSMVFLGLSLSYLAGEKYLLNFALSFYEKIKNSVPYELDHAFLKKIADHFLNSPVVIFIAMLLIAKLLLLKSMFTLRKIGFLFLFVISMDCILPHKIYHVAHDDYRRLWEVKSPEKDFFAKLTFSDRVAIRSLVSRFVGEGWHNINSADLPEYFSGKDLESIRKRAWFPDYRYRNPGYAQYSHSVFMISAWQGLNHTLPSYLKDYTLEINSKIDRNKVDFADLLILDADSRLIDIAGINYILSSLPLKRPGLELLFKGRQYYVYRNKNAFPKAYFANQYRQFSEKDSTEDIFDYLLDIDDKQAAIISGSQITHTDFLLSKAPNYSIDFLKYNPNEIVLSVGTDSDGFLVLNDTYYPGWMVSVDGKEERIYRANMAFRAVFLKPGLHRVEFRYNPVGFMSGLVVSCLSIIFVVGVLLFNRKTQRVS